MMNKFLNSTSGSVAVMTGLVFSVLALASAGAIDYSRSVEAQQFLQRNVDAATLAAARSQDSSQSEQVYQSLMDNSEDNGGFYKLEDEKTKISEVDGRFVGTASAQVPLIFGNLLPTSVVTINALAVVGNVPAPVEIALVVDVSSSMPEEGRLEPALEALRNFISTARSPDGSQDHVRIALIPFSSRVNLGVESTSHLESWNGAPAVPDRWVNPSDHYNVNYAKRTWIDQENFAMHRDDNDRYYWMGCVEPRIDVAWASGNGTGSAPSDASPINEPFIAMDHNPGSATNFCPTPIVPLTTDAQTLNKAIDAMTTNGSTRLDAGIAAGWYALSPNWTPFWGSDAGPADYDAPVQKHLIFMTDGQMNTQDGKLKNGQPKKHFDWICTGAGNCDKRAGDFFLETCNAIKARGVTIHTVSYDPDAEEDDLETCATAAEHAYKANSMGGQNFIANLYGRIAADIANGAGRLSLIK